MPRLAVLAVVVVSTLVAAAGPASADGGAGATNYRTTLLALQPDVPGVTVRVVGTGSRFELTNTTTEDVVVLGYQREPYLRVGPRGVFENVRSPTANPGGNSSRAATIRAGAGQSPAPQWRRLSGGRTARWQDQRLDFLANQGSPGVRRQPGRRHVVIPAWTIAMTKGDSTVTATGNVVWVPGPSPLAWALVAGSALVLVIVAARRRRWMGVATGVLGALLAIDVVHSWGIAWSAAGGPAERLGAFVGGSFFSIIAWAVGAVGVWLLARRSTDGFLAAGLAGSFIALNGGLAHVPVLFRSQVSFALGADLARALVALSIGLGIGLTAGAIIALLRTPLPRGAPGDGRRLVSAA